MNLRYSNVETDEPEVEENTEEISESIEENPEYAEENDNSKSSDGIVARIQKIMKGRGNESK